jgi:hypothetical protein
MDIPDATFWMTSKGARCASVFFDELWALLLPGSFRYVGREPRRQQKEMIE